MVGNMRVVVGLGCPTRSNYKQNKKIHFGMAAERPYFDLTHYLIASVAYSDQADISSTSPEESKF